MLEGLEYRRMLAGNVSAEVRDHVLIINGDSKSNSITLFQEANGQYDVIGNEGTRINRTQLNQRFDASIVSSIQIRLNGGDDTLLVQRVIVTGDLVIQSGLDDDQLVIRRVRIGKRLFIEDLAGQSDIALHAVVTQGKLRVLTGDKSDAVSVNASVVYGTSLIESGGAEDSIHIADSEFLRATALNAGDENDSIYREVIKRFDFNRGFQGWTTGFADYLAGPVSFPDNREAPEAWEFKSRLSKLPSEISPDGQGIFMSGINRSDDLFMYLMRELSAADGLETSQNYQVEFQVVMYSNAPRNAVGVGGSPGESVHVDAGAYSERPVVDFAHQNAGSNVKYVRLIVGERPIVDPSTNGIELGNISNDLDADDLAIDERPYRKIVRSGTTQMKTKEDGSPMGWLVIGTNSGFEGRTSIFYGSVRVTLHPVKG